MMDISSVWKPLPNFGGHAINFVGSVLEEGLTSSSGAARRQATAEARFCAGYSLNLVSFHNNSHQIRAKRPNFEIAVDSHNLSAKFLHDEHVY